MPWRSAVLGHVMGWLSDIYQLMACLSTLTNIQCATLHSTGLPGLKVTLGNYRGSLVSVRFWYRKRGFLGLCFFDENETHPANLFFQYQIPSWRLRGPDPSLREGWSCQHPARGQE